jgi:hypothetical protein
MQMPLPSEVGEYTKHFPTTCYKQHRDKKNRGSVPDLKED